MVAAIVRPEIDRHRIAFRMSSEMTSNYRRVHQPRALAMSFEDVVALLRKERINFVLMGTHGIAGWRSETRSTQDVDVLVAKRHHAKAIRTIQAGYPTLVMEDTEVVTRFSDPAVGYVVIDLMKPTQPVFEMIFRNAVAVDGGAYKIPSLEMALVSKFAAMTSHNRKRSKKIIDVGDFFDIVECRSDEIDLKKLSRLAEAVYKGGGREILQLVKDFHEGRPITI